MFKTLVVFEKRERENNGKQILEVAMFLCVDAADIFGILWNLVETGWGPVRSRIIFPSMFLKSALNKKTKP